jgi:MinD-like ATPase involved in chromosome partitioning or flagellar assembly
MSDTRVITFYSYKGGAGRTMALANVAWILASNARRVLAIDWDLEAPGLHHYFRPFLRDPDLQSTRGLIDYFVEFATGAVMGTPAPRRILHYASSIEWEFPGGGAIDLIGAGRLDPTYALRVNGFSWQSFYERLGGSSLLGAMKEEFAEYEYVLIDSRTGVSDYAGICTVVMPDALVVCFTMNAQSVDGAAAVVQNVIQQRSGQRLEVFPVPMRVEYGEKELLERARTAARERFAHLAVVHDVDYWGRVEFLYVPYYAFHEMLAAFADTPFSTSSVLSAAVNLTAHLTQGAVTAVPELPRAMREEVLRAYTTRMPAMGRVEPRPK